MGYDLVGDGDLEFWAEPDEADAVSKAPPAAAASTPPEDARESYTCPRCGRTSHNPHDATYRYCGACRWSEDWGEPPQ